MSTTQAQTGLGLNLQQCLTLEQGQVSLRFPPGAIPTPLYQAYEQFCQGKPEAALALLTEECLSEYQKRMSASRPNAAMVGLLVGMIFQGGGRLRSALTWFTHVAGIEEHALVYNEMAQLQHALCQYGAALKSRTRAVALVPDDRTLQEHLPMAQIFAGRIREGLQGLQQRFQSSPNSAYLWYAHYLPEQTRASLWQAHQAWARPWESYTPIHVPIQKHDRLRIGYVSGDFKMNAIVHFFAPLLLGHDRQQVEVYGYGNIDRPDSVTEQLIAAFDHYRSIWGQDDASVVEQIRADAIDVLVDLSGHSERNRLGVFAQRVAPVQVSYLGYSDTTGLVTMDYHLSDAIVDPIETSATFSERLWHLPGSFACYQPPAEAPEVSPLPSKDGGGLTFGSFNGIWKLNPEVIRLWARVLHACVDSRLVLRFAGGDDPCLQHFVRDQFAEQGIDTKRLSFTGWQDLTSHLAAYGQVDMILDTFPWTGHTNTCEALWMGVPVLTLPGELGVSRLAQSVLTHLGLDFLVAQSAEDYVNKACAMAQNPKALTQLRTSLRPLMAGSDLCQGHVFAGHIETAFRAMVEERMSE